jgi:NADPH:quinone reductase-like Zn-dependent oxidoreductase
MKARGLAALTAKAELTSYEFDRRELGAHDVALDIAYAGICHSDIHQVREEWGPAIFPMDTRSQEQSVQSEVLLPSLQLVIVLVLASLLIHVESAQAA